MSDFKLMKVAHVYLGYHRVKFTGFSVRGVAPDSVEMQNREIISNLEPSLRAAIIEYAISSSRSTGMVGAPDYHNAWIELLDVTMDKEAGPETLAILDFFRTQCVNTWGRVGASSFRTDYDRTPGDGGGRVCYGEEYFDFAIDEADSMTEERIMADLRTVAKLDERIRNVIDLPGILTTADAEHDRAMIRSNVGAAAGRLKAAGIDDFEEALRLRLDPARGSD